MSFSASTQTIQYLVLKNQILRLSEYIYAPEDIQEGLGPVFVVASTFTLGLC